jgi:hypothetical protein
MGMAVGDHVATRKRRGKAPVARHGRTGIVHQADAKAVGLDLQALRQSGFHGGLVHIAVHGGDPTKLAELLEHNRPGEITDVQDELGAFEQVSARVGKAPRAAREMRVADERDQRKSGRKAPSR